MEDLNAGAPGESSGFSSAIDSTFESADTGTEETETAEAPVVEAAAEPEPESPENPEPAEPAAEPEVEAAPDPDKPAVEPPADDVRVIERDGKKEFRMNEQRYRLYEDGHHLRRELEQRLVPETVDGKPVTTDDIRAAINVREKAFLGNEEMHLDFLSGDPVSQRRFVDHWIDQGKRALELGEVGADPVVPLATTFFDTIAAKHPEAYAQIQGRAATQLLDDLYELANADGNKNLLYSAQHIEKQLFNRYRKEDGTVVQVAPEKRAPAPRSQQQPQQTARQQPDANQQQWQNYRVKTDTDSKSAIHKAVETSLADIKTAYDKAGLPETYGAVLDRLNSTVLKELTTDAEWQRQISIELNKARMSPSEQKRLEIGASIVRRHATRAQQIIQRNIGKITSEASKALKVSFDANHQRRQAAQDKRAPAGGGPAPKTSLIPTSREAWQGPKSFEKDLDRLFA